MKHPQKVRKFAKMFLNAIGDDDFPAALNELAAINKLMSASRDFKGVLENPVFTEQEKGNAIKGVAGWLMLSDNTVRFLAILSAQRIISCLPELMRFATAIYLERKKKAKAVITTPVDIKKDYDDRLRNSLKNLTGMDVDIEYIVDPSVIGGMIVKVESTMYDSSLKGQLRLLKDDITKG